MHTGYQMFDFPQYLFNNPEQNKRELSTVVQPTVTKKSFHIPNLKTLKYSVSIYIASSSQLWRTLRTNREGVN